MTNVNRHKEVFRLIKTGTLFLFLTVTLISRASAQNVITIPEGAVTGKSIDHLLSSTDTAEEFQSFLLLKKAEKQLNAGKPDESRVSLDQLKTLEYIPEHHRLYAEQLRARIDGTHNTSFDKTPRPRFDKVAVSLYVSQEKAKSKGKGTLKKPFSSVMSALEHARTLRKKGGLADGAIEIVLLDKLYSMKEAIVLGSVDSGTRRNPLVIRSVDETKPSVISGGCVLDTWSTEKDPSILTRLPESSRGRVLRASLENHDAPNSGELVFGGFSSQRAMGGSHSFKTFPVMELFHKGQAQTMARWPNDGDSDMPLDNFNDSRLAKWQQEEGLWLHGYWYWAWADAYEKVKSIDSSKNLITLEEPFNRYGFRDSKWHVVNALCELDQPGEWHLDVATQTVRYLPPSDFNPKDCVFSAYGPCITASGCDYVAIKDIDLQYIRGDALLFSDCNDISVSNCSIRAASGYGIRAFGGVRYLFHTVNIEHMGRGGIEIVSGDWKQLIPSGTIIENCTISDLSRIDRTYTPAILMEGMDITVRHCLFSNIPSSAIRMEVSESLIELNEFTRCVEESDDQGAIDVWGNPLYRRNIIRWNYFHDNTGRHGMVCGVRLDDAISDFMISRNIFLRSSGGHFGGIQIHGGKQNYVDGNIFIDCQAGISNSPWGDRWKERVASHAGIVKHMSSTPWQDEVWSRRYPELAELIDGAPDLNYFAANRMINCEKDFIRMSPNAILLINTEAKQQNAPANLEELKQSKVINTLIPVRRIGNY